MILEPCTSSDEQSSSKLVSVRPSTLCGIDLLPPASGTAKLKIYDNNVASTSGATVLFECSVDTGEASSSFNASIARLAKKGIYAVLTGTTTYVIGYVVVG